MSTDKPVGSHLTTGTQDEKVDPNNHSLIKINSKALIKSYNLNFRVVFTTSSVLVGLTVYLFVISKIGLIALSVILFTLFGFIFWYSAYLLRSCFIDKSFDTLISRIPARNRVYVTSK
jgi:hypothetical protein